MEIRELEAGSFTTGELPAGCEICARGAKMVLLVTGECSCGCFYCPLSLEKQGLDVIYANEMRVGEEQDILLEALAIGAEGSSLTGGDPLCKLDRSLRFISLLKSEFGERHHVHLYTATPAGIGELERLHSAGLDAIRFHPPLKNWSGLTVAFSEAIASAARLGMAAGVEVPVLPDKGGELRALLTRLDALEVAYVNLNELEFSEGNWQALAKKGYRVLDDVSSAVRGSRELAVELAEELDLGYTVHFCSSSFKDAVQLRNRIIRRAANTRTSLDIVTEEGTFVRGIIETHETKAMVERLDSEFSIPPELYWLEEGRIVIAAWVLEDIWRDLEAPCFIVEEYPTADRLEVERRPLA